MHRQRLSEVGPTQRQRSPQNLLVYRCHSKRAQDSIGGSSGKLGTLRTRNQIEDGRDPMSGNEPPTLSPFQWNKPTGAARWLWLSSPEQRQARCSGRAVAVSPVLPLQMTPILLVRNTLGRSPQHAQDRRILLGRLRWRDHEVKIPLDHPRDRRAMPGGCVRPARRLSRPH